MKRELTDEQRAAYIAGGGTACPFCGSIVLSGDVVEVDAGTARQDIDCTGCGVGWTDVYTLTAIENIEAD